MSVSRVAPFKRACSIVANYILEKVPNRRRTQIFQSGYVLLSMSDRPSHLTVLEPGASPNCTLYADVIDGWTCESVLDTYDLTIAQFYAYNPAVGSDCSTLVLGISFLVFLITRSILLLFPGYQYCIQTPDYVDQTLSSTSSTGGTAVATPTTTGKASSTPTSPVQSGQPTNCHIWYTAQCNYSLLDPSAHLKVTYHLQPATRVHRSKMYTSSRTHNSTPGTLRYPQIARLDSGPVSLYVSDLPDHLLASFLLTSAHHPLYVACLNQSHPNELLTNHAFTQYRLCLLCWHNRRDRLAHFVGISNV